MYIICKIVLLQSHHESRRAKIAADIISGSFMNHDTGYGRSSQANCIVGCNVPCSACASAFTQHILVIQEFKKCISHKVCTMHTKISTVQNSNQ